MRGPLAGLVADKELERDVTDMVYVGRRSLREVAKALKGPPPEGWMRETAVPERCGDECKGGWERR